MKIHFEIETLYETEYASLCGATTTTKNGTFDERQVTCKKCIEVLTEEYHGFKSTAV